MILDELKKIEKSTQQEQVLIDFILRDPAHVLTLTTRQIAQETYTSASAVTRLCQKVGERGFTDFKLRLIAELNAQKNGIYAEMSRPLMEYGLSSEQLIERGLQFYRQVAYETKCRLNTEKLTKIRALVNNAELLEIYGTGINYSIAQTASFKFQSLGLRCQAYNELNVQSFVNSGLDNRKRVVFLISHTGATPSLLRVAKIFKKNKTPIVALCEAEDSPLAKYANIHVPIINMGDLSMLSLLSYPLSCAYIFDLIYMSILTTNINKQFRITAEEYYTDFS